MDLTHYKKLLEAEKEKFVKEIAFYKQSDPYLDKNRSPETFDDAVSDIEGHDRVAATKSEIEISLKETEAALARIENGIFGVCINCGQKINPGRLEAMPSVALCTSCQEQKKGA